MRQKFIVIIILSLGVYSSFGQSCTLKFTCKYNGQYAPFDHVKISNITQSWTEYLYWSDTVFTMGGTNVYDQYSNDIIDVITNYPNPCNGKTTFSVYFPKENSISVEILDLKGTIITQNRFIDLNQGTHVFEINLSVPKVYVVILNYKNGRDIFKIVNVGCGNNNSITYREYKEHSPYTRTKESDFNRANHPFHPGDSMVYVGYIINDGYTITDNNIVYKDTIRKKQFSSELITFYFKKGIPTIKTKPITDIGSTSAKTGVSIIDTGDSHIISQGICYGFTPRPTITNDFVIYDTSNVLLNDFSCEISGLTNNIIYYVRAFAINATGIEYGENLSFVTNTHSSSTCIETPTATDIDGNTYNTIQIGDQCWLRENLRSLHYSNGDKILNSNYNSYLMNSFAPQKPVGYRYKWQTVVNNEISSESNSYSIQGVCPDGWHIPTKSEWDTLFSYVGAQPLYICGNNNTYIAKALCSNYDWLSSTNTCAPGNDQSSNNSTGFTALPNGESLSNYGLFADFWTATSNNQGCGYEVFITVDNQRISFANGFGNDMYAVRCIKGDNYLPKVTTGSISFVNDSTILCGGSVYNSGSTSIISCGICWGEFANPTIEDNHTSDIIINGSFTSIVQGLLKSYPYHLRAYVISSVGIVYGEDVLVAKFNTLDSEPCVPIPTLSDYDGNIYNTVQIGAQCWMKENLKTKHFSDGSLILLNTNNQASRFFPNNDSALVQNFGYLYNWKAALKNAPSPVLDTQFVQGVCPDGWHLPNLSDWQQLENYMSCQAQYICGDDNLNITKALSDSICWEQTVDECSVGSDLENNNASGFGALPAGRSYGSLSNGFGYYTWYWSSSSHDSDLGNHISIGYNNAKITMGSCDKENGLSVRCIKDN